MLREAFLLQSLSSHVHVVDVYGVVSEGVLDGVFMTVMEQALYGNLKACVQGTAGSWTNDSTQTALCQVGQLCVLEADQPDYERGP